MFLNRRGFTLVEILVAVTLGAIVIAAVYQTVINTQRAAQAVAQRMDVQQNLRTASHYLSTMLRELDATDGDITAASSNLIQFRSPRWMGTLCANPVRLNATQVQFDLGAGWMLGNRGPDPVLDSVLVYRQGQESLRLDDLWLQGAVRTVGTGTCLTGSASIRINVDVAPVNGGADSAAVGVLWGAPVRGFQMEELSITTSGGRSWVGQRTADAAGTWTTVQPLVGPIESNGLEFTFLDSTGAVTTNPRQLLSIRFVVRGESPRRARTGSGAIDYIRDSISTRIQVRNNQRY